jgi:hypothetical protein
MFSGVHMWMQRTLCAYVRRCALKIHISHYGTMSILFLGERVKKLQNPLMEFENICVRFGLEHLIIERTRRAQVKSHKGC